MVGLTMDSFNSGKKTNTFWLHYTYCIVSLIEIYNE